MVPVSRFKSRIGVAKFDREAEWAGDLPVAQALWRLPLSQHVGKPSEPVVAVGDEVAAGQLIARGAGGHLRGAARAGRGNNLPRDGYGN